jgi:hypothetical protein
MFLPTPPGVYEHDPGTDVPRSSEDDDDDDDDDDEEDVVLFLH